MNLNTFYVVPGYTFFYWGFTLKKETYPEFKKHFSLKEGNLLAPITLEINRKKYDAKIRITRINNKGKFKNRSETIYPERENKICARRRKEKSRKSSQRCLTILQVFY